MLRLAIRVFFIGTLTHGKPGETASEQALPKQFIAKEEIRGNRLNDSICNKENAASRILPPLSP
jgi:hypothetical protein